MWMLKVEGCNIEEALIGHEVNMIDLICSEAILG